MGLGIYCTHDCGENTSYTRRIVKLRRSIIQDQIVVIVRTFTKIVIRCLNVQIVQIVQIVTNVRRLLKYNPGLEIAACQWPNGRPNFRFGR